MFCTKCGKQIPDDLRTCPSCGCDLSYESNVVRNHLTPKKTEKKKSHAGGILIGCAFALLAAEGIFLIGYAPVRPAKSASAAAAPAVSSWQGVVDLIPTAAPEASSVPEASSAPDTSSGSSPATHASALSAEPTPTPTVTPVGQIPASEVTALAPPSAPSQGTASGPSPEMEVVIEDETVLNTDQMDSSDTILPIDGSQVFPMSSTEPIPASALEGMSAEELRIARNEIYARHGLIFKSGELDDYFRSKDWYEGTVPDADSITLNEQESENVRRIVEYEEAMGFN